LAWPVGARGPCRFRPRRAGCGLPHLIMGPCGWRGRFTSGPACVCWARMAASGDGAVGGSGPTRPRAGSRGGVCELGGHLDRIAQAKTWLSNRISYT